MDEDEDDNDLLLGGCGYRGNPALNKNAERERVWVRVKAEPLLFHHARLCWVWGSRSTSSGRGVGVQYARQYTHPGNE